MTVIEDIVAKQNQNTKNVLSLFQDKLDVSKYENSNEKSIQDFETMRMGLKDNFEQLLATDNFLEKYLPFQI